MENKINIADLLRDCPPGMELDCTMYDNVKLKYISVYKDEDYPICIETDCGYITKLTKYGQYIDTDEAKCVIFPKGKTTWEGFVPPCKFKDGDIVAMRNDCGIHIFIYNYTKNEYSIAYHAIFTSRDIFKINGFCNGDHYRLATEEEKQKLFDAIKENGYYWNEYKKTLGTLVKPKFKVGDKIRKIKNINEEHIINEVTELTYVCYINTYHNTRIPIKSQDEWELIPDKFDISTLKPFDKVLVRDNVNQKWNITFFSCIDNAKMFKTMTGIYYQCIPYVGNENLLSTNNNCIDYYKTWEG